jgi:hypothetical protein
MLTIVVSTRLKRGSEIQMRIVVAVNIMSCLYEGKNDDVVAGIDAVAAELVVLFSP